MRKKTKSMYKLGKTTKEKEFQNKRPMGRRILRKKKNSSKSDRQRQPLCKRRMGNRIVRNQTTEMQKNTKWNTEMKISLIIIDEEERQKGRGFMK